MKSTTHKPLYRKWTGPIDKIGKYHGLIWTRFDDNKRVHDKTNKNIKPVR